MEVIHMTQYKGVYVLYDNHISLYTKEDIEGQRVALKESYIRYVLDKLQHGGKYVTVEIRLAYEDGETMDVKKYIYDKSSNILSNYVYDATINNYALMGEQRHASLDLLAERVHTSTRDTLEFVTTLLM